MLILVTTAACLSLLFGVLEGQTSVEENNHASSSAEQMTKRLVFFGDSLTSGFTLPQSQAYPALIQQQLALVGLPGTVENSGINGNTSEDGLRRISSELKSPITVFVLALGVNDAQYGIPVEEAGSNLQKILNQVKAASPKVKFVVAGVKLPLLMPDRQQIEFGEMHRLLAERNQALFIPDILQGVADHPELLLADGVHPNAQGHVEIANKLWPVLKPILSP